MVFLFRAIINCMSAVHAKVDTSKQLDSLCQSTILTSHFLTTLQGGEPSPGVAYMPLLTHLGDGGSGCLHKGLLFSDSADLQGHIKCTNQFRQQLFKNNLYLSTDRDSLCKQELLFLRSSPHF